MAEKIRILHVLGIMDCGGAETFLMNLYRNIDRERIQFDFVVHREKEGYYNKEIKILGGKIYTAPQYCVLNYLQYKKWWISFFNQHHEYKVVHGHVPSTAAVYLNEAHKFKIKTVMHSHTTSSGKGFSAFLRNILQYPVRYYSDYRFACSEAAGKWLFGDNKSFKVINNGVDVKKFLFDTETRNSIRRQYHLTDKFLVGHVGRFNEPKNHSFIIDVFNQIHKINPNSALMLIGEGPLQTQIKNKVQNLNLTDSVLFTGVKSNVQDYLSAMDVLLFPSLWEGLGMALIEGQANGLKCFASLNRVPACAKLTDLVSFISLDESAEFWASYILNCDFRYNRTQYNSMLAVTDYDIEKIADEMENFYFSAVGMRCDI